MFIERAVWECTSSFFKDDGYDVTVWIDKNGGGVREILSADNIGKMMYAIVIIAVLLSDVRIDI